MWKDPIVEELDRYREAHAKQFNYDARAIYEDMKAKCRQYELEGWRVVSQVGAKTSSAPISELDSVETPARGNEKK